MNELHHDECSINVRCVLDQEVADAFWSAVYDIGSRVATVSECIEYYLRHNGYLPEELE